VSQIQTRSAPSPTSSAHARRSTTLRLKDARPGARRFDPGTTTAPLAIVFLVWQHFQYSTVFGGQSDSKRQDRNRALDHAAPGAQRTAARCGYGAF